MKCNNCLKMIHPEEGQVALFCPYCGAPLTGTSGGPYAYAYKEEEYKPGGDSEQKEKTGTTHTENYSYGQGRAGKTESSASYSYGHGRAGKTESSASYSYGHGTAGKAESSSTGGSVQSESVQQSTVKWGHTGETFTRNYSQPANKVNEKNEKKVKKGVKKYIAAIIFYILLFFYCLDEQAGGRATALAVIMILLAAGGILIRKGIIAKKWPSMASSLLIASLLLIFPFAYVSETDRYNNWQTIESHEKIQWPKEGLAGMLPSPVSDYGRIYTDNELEFDAEFYNISEYRYRAYVESLKRLGFTNVDYDFSTSFHAANADNYKVYVWLDSYSEMTVDLQSPKQLSYIDWPENEMAELLPVPEELYGRVDVDRSGFCEICLGRIYEEDFKEYIRDCRSYGFTEDYERTRHSYMAYDEDDNLLFLQWDEKLNTMIIQIWNQEETTDSEGEDLADELEQEMADEEEYIL